MIPIVSISNLVTVPFLLFISFSLLASFLKTKNKNIGYFFVGTLFLSITEVILSGPGLVFKDPRQISVIFAVYPFLIITALGFWGAIPLNIMNKKNFETGLIAAAIIISLVVTFANLANIREAVIYQQAPFIYWEDTRGVAMNIFIGVMVSAILLYLIFFFFLNGLRSQDRYVKVRSFFIASGLAVFFCGAIANFVIGASLSAHKYIGSMATSLLLLVGVLAIFSGIRRKNKTQERQDGQLQW